MDERIDQTQGWISDTLAMGLYSTLLCLVMLLWSTFRLEFIRPAGRSVRFKTIQTRPKDLPVLPP
jgi:hypothetical protein